MEQFIDRIPKDILKEVERIDNKWRDTMIEETLNHLDYTVVKNLNNGEVIIKPNPQENE